MKALAAALALAAAPSFAAEPIVGLAQPLHAGGLTMMLGGDGALSVAGQGGEIARYDLSGCLFCEGEEDNCAADGIFPLLLEGQDAPLIGAVCHVGAHSQRLAVFAPLNDPKRAVFEVTGDYFATAAILPGALVAAYDRDRAQLTAVYPPDAPASPPQTFPPPPAPDADGPGAELAARLADIAAARDEAALVALADPAITVSFGGDGGVAELRAMIAEEGEAFWSDLAAIAAMGGALDPFAEDGLVAVPSHFDAIPADADAFTLWRNPVGTPLLTGPADTAPVAAVAAPGWLVESYDIAAYEALMDAGWVLACAPEGCGYARRSGLRHALDRRAVFLREGPDAPWRLVALVAGD